jgi:hypothetical protein
MEAGLGMFFEFVLLGGFLFVGTFTVIDYYKFQDLGSNGTIVSNHSIADGFYHRGGPNNATWIWNTTLYHPGLVRHCSGFASCADQDALVNELWLGKAHALKILGALALVLLAVLLLHIAGVATGIVDSVGGRCCSCGRDKRKAKRVARKAVKGMVKQGEIVHSAEVDKPLLKAQRQASPDLEREAYRDRSVSPTRGVELAQPVERVRGESDGTELRSMAK